MASSSNDNEQSLAQFLRGLPTLECLDLEGYIVGDALEAIEQHGNVLRRLRLMPHYAMSYDLAAKVLGWFSHLEWVALPLQRTQGDEREVAAYCSLAQLPRLRHVQLRLDCGVDQSEPRRDEQWVERFRNALTNTAVDQDLALSIFQALGAHVEYLRIDVQFPSPRRGRRLDREAYELLRWVGRGWLVRKSRTCETTTVEQVDSRVETGSEKPEVADRLLRSDFDKRPDLRAAWIGAWPGEPGDRRQQWSSVPLAGKAFTDAYEGHGLQDLYLA